VMPYTTEEANSIFIKESVFKGQWPEYKEIASGSDYAINGMLFSSKIADIGYESLGAFLNSIISEVRKAKAKEKKALNYEISSININVPEEYYKATLSSKEELMH